MKDRMLREENLKLLKVQQPLMLSQQRKNLLKTERNGVLNILMRLSSLRKNGKQYLKKLKKSI
jgi:ribosome recycling factor